MRNSSDQGISDAADRAQAGDTAATEVADALDSPSGEEPQDTSDAKEAFEGFDGSWDYEWVARAEAFMETVPWTWIAVAVFIGGMVYSYRKQKGA